MTTAHQEPVVQPSRPSTRRLVCSGAVAGVIAAGCTTGVAAFASAADVSLEVNAEAIPIVAFAWWTIIGAAVGIVFARLLRERRRFIVVTTVAAGLSLIPPIAAPDDTATTVVLVGTHLLGAAIIITILSHRLPDGQQRPLNESREHPLGSAAEHRRGHRTVPRTVRN